MRERKHSSHSHKALLLSAFFDANEHLQFAIKKLKDKFEDLNEVIAYREYQAIVALSEGCDNLCHISDVLREADGSLYFVCEYMPDGTLNDFIQSFHNRGMKIEESLIYHHLTRQ